MKPFEPVHDYQFKFSIEKVTIEAKPTRTVAEYTWEQGDLVWLYGSPDPLMYLTSTCHWNKFEPYYRHKSGRLKSKHWYNTRINYPASFRKQMRRK